MQLAAARHERVRHVLQYCLGGTVGLRQLLDLPVRQGLAELVRAHQELDLGQRALEDRHLLLEDEDLRVVMRGELVALLEGGPLQAVADLAVPGLEVGEVAFHLFLDDHLFELPGVLLRRGRGLRCAKQGGGITIAEICIIGVYSPSLHCCL